MTHANPPEPHQQSPLRHQRDDLGAPESSGAVSCPTTSRHRDMDVVRSKVDFAQARAARSTRESAVAVPTQAGLRLVGRSIAVFILVALALAVTLRLSVLMLTSDGQADRPLITAGPTVVPDIARFALNAFLVPALDTDALPLRWTDPRPVASCGPDSVVLVDGAPLVPGAPVPFGPFELDWHAASCRPFGKSGPRFDGRLTLTVYREDWGFSAMIHPGHDPGTGMRVTLPGSLTTLIPPDAVFTPITTPLTPGTSDHGSR